VELRATPQGKIQTLRCGELVVLTAHFRPFATGGPLKGGTESSTVKDLLEQALAKNLGEQFAVMIRNTIQEAVRTELQKDRAWLRKINLSEYLAAEQGRLHAIDLHRLLIPPDQDINQKIKEHRKESFKHLKFYIHSIEVQDEQQSWPSSK
jgi:hypothetical protein